MSIYFCVQPKRTDVYGFVYYNGKVPIRFGFCITLFDYYLYIRSSDTRLVYTRVHYSYIWLRDKDLIDENAYTLIQNNVTGFKYCKIYGYENSEKKNEIFNHLRVYI